MKKLILFVVAGLLVLNGNAGKYGKDGGYRRKCNRPDSPFVGLPVMPRFIQRQRSMTPEPQILAPQTPPHLQGYNLLERLDSGTYSESDELVIPETPPASPVNQVFYSDEDGFTTESTVVDTEDEIIEPTQNYSQFNLWQLYETLGGKKIILQSGDRTTTLKDITKCLKLFNKGKERKWSIGVDPQHISEVVTVTPVKEKDQLTGQLACDDTLFGHEVVMPFLQRVIVFNEDEKRFQIKSLQSMKAEVTVMRSNKGTRALVEIND